MKTFEVTFESAEFEVATVKAENEEQALEIVKERPDLLKWAYSETTNTEVKEVKQ